MAMFATIIIIIITVYRARPVLRARTSNVNFRATRGTMVAMLAVASTVSRIIIIRNLLPAAKSCSFGSSLSERE